MYGYGTTQTPYAGATGTTGYVVNTTTGSTDATAYTYPHGYGTTTYGTTSYDATAAYGSTGYTAASYGATGYGSMGYGATGTTTGYGTSSAYGPYGTSTDTNAYGYGYPVGDASSSYGMMGATTTSTWPSQPPPPPPDVVPTEMIAKDVNASNWKSFQNKPKATVKKPVVGVMQKPNTAVNSQKQNTIKQFYNDVQQPEPAAIEESDEDDVEPGKEYFCDLCDHDCKTLNSYINHTRGLKHAQKTMESENPPKKSEPGSDAATPVAPPVYKPPVQNKLATTYPDTSMFSTFLKLPGSEPVEQEPTVYPGGEEVQMGSGTSTAYYCEVCCCMMTGPKAFEDHMTGIRHKKNLKHRAEGNPITKTRSNKKPANELDSASTTPGHATVMTALGKVTDPLIGLQFVTELQKYGVNFEHRYVCNMCENMCDPRTLISHVIGSKHRINYMKERYMNYYSIVKQKSSNKSEQNPLVEEYARTIECEEGRQDVMIKKDTEGFAGVIKAPVKEVPAQPLRPNNSKRKSSNDEYGAKRGRSGNRGDGGKRSGCFDNNGPNNMGSAKHGRGFNRGDGGMRGGGFGNNGPNNMGSGFHMNMGSDFDDFGMDAFMNNDLWECPGRGGHGGRGGRGGCGGNGGFINNVANDLSGFNGDEFDDNNKDDWCGGQGGFGGNRGKFGGGRSGFGGNRSGFRGIRGGFRGGRGGFIGDEDGFGGIGGGNLDNLGCELGGFGGNRGGFCGKRGGFGGNRCGFGGNRGSFGGNQGGFGGNRGGVGGNQGGFGGNRGGFGGNQGGFGGNRGGFGGNRGDFDGDIDEFDENPDDFGGNRGGFGGNRAGFLGNRGGRDRNRGGRGSKQFGGGRGQGRGRGQKGSSGEKNSGDDVQISAVKGGASAGIGKFLEEMANCLVNNEQDAAMALEVSNQLTSALMDFRMKGISDKMEKNAARKTN